MVIEVDGDQVSGNWQLVHDLLEKRKHCVGDSLVGDCVDKAEVVSLRRSFHVAADSTHDSSAGATVGLYWQRYGHVIRPGLSPDV